MYKFPIGADIDIPLLVETGDIGTVSGMTAKLRKIVNEGGSLNDADPVGLDMIVIPLSPFTGWTLRYPAASSLNLAEGIYQVDAKYVVGSTTFITDVPAKVFVTENAFS